MQILDRRRSKELYKSSLSKFFNLPDNEICLDVYSGGLKRTITHRGEFYVSPHYICFFSKTLGMKIKEVIPFSEIISIETLHQSIENINAWFHSYIFIKTKEKQYDFTSFGSKREKIYDQILTLWKESQNTKEHEHLLVDEGMQTDMTEGRPQKQDEDENNVVLCARPSEEQIAKFLKEHEALRPEQMVSIELPCSLHECFQLLYSNGSNFNELYHEKRGDKDYKSTEWEKTDVGPTRSITYTVDTHAAIGPDTSRCEETQRYILTNRELFLYFSLSMLDVPYHDYFRVEGLHRVTAISKRKCSLTIEIAVVFQKSTFLAGTIKKTTLKQNKESWNMFAELALREISKKKHRRIEQATNNFPASRQDTVQPKNAWRLYILLIPFFFVFLVILYQLFLVKSIARDLHDIREELDEFLFRITQR